MTSRYFPPRPGGAPTTYANLLKHLDQREVWILAGPMGPFTDSTSELQCQVEVVPSVVPRWVKGKAYVSFLDILNVARVGARLVREQRLTRILATYPDMTFLIASYLIHRWTGVPLYPYLHDTVLEAQRGLPGKTLARLFQDRIFQSATQVLVLTPGLEEFYRRKYGMETVLIPHCLDDALLGLKDDDADSETSREKAVVFSGGVYWLNTDSLRLLAQAIHSLEGLRLEITSITSRREIEQFGIAGPKVTVSFLEDHRNVVALQRRAALLYLPLTFDRAHAEEVDSAFPTKLIEYLVAGVPILVHAPSASLLARFSREEGCALVVDQPDAEALGVAIRRLLDDDALRQRLVANAFRVAQRFRGEPVARRLMEEMFGERGEEYLAKPQQERP